MSDTTTIEQSIIHCVMNYLECLDDIKSILNADDFSSQRNRIVWKAITALNLQKKIFDHLSVEGFLTDSHQIDQVGGIEYIRYLQFQCYASPDAAKHYAQQVRNMAVIRLLQDAGNRITELASNHMGRPINEILSEAESILSSVVAGNVSDGIEVVDGVHLMRKVTSDFDQASQNPGISGVTTGIPSLDTKTDGLQRGNMIVVAGPPSMGKTAFAVNLMQNALPKADLPIVIFSMEMPAVDIGRRMLSTESKIGYTGIKRGIATEDEATRIYLAASRLQNPLLKVCEDGGLNPSRMRAVLKRIAREHGGIGMAMVDYVQLMEADRLMPNNRNGELTAISRELKRMAMDFHMPFIVLSQLTKDVEKAKRRPTNGDLRETGALAQDADLIMMVHRQEKYDDQPKQENMGKAEILITKNRNGGTGAVLMGYDAQTLRFHELAKGWEVDL